MSPATVIRRQLGNSFEFATCLCSLLTATGYDAYVVHGYAARDITQRLLIRTDCPIKPYTPPKEEVKVEAVENKYELRPIRDLRSKFLLYMAQREIDLAEEERRKKREKKRKEMEELEKPPPDDLHGWRVHAWVVVLPGKDVEKTFFIEPTTAVVYQMDSPIYISVEAVWNHLNYWVNIQDQSKGIVAMQWALEDYSKWEHLFIGEPITKRVYSMDMEAEIDPAKSPLDEKHLDAPRSWCEPIDIPHDVFKIRFPSGDKITKYKRVILEQFGEYVQMDGLAQRITYYSDLDYKYVLSIEEYYENRKDCLQIVCKDLQTDQVIEYFKFGREGAHKSHTYFSKESSVEDRRSIEFYHVSRIDGLSKVEMSPLYYMENYVNREDRLYYRHAKFATRGQPPKGMIEGVRRIVTSVVEKFSRNPNVKADEDIAQREFALVDNEIRLKYHYASGHVTSSTRNFVKPNVAEQGEDLTFNPDLTSGYLADLAAKPPTQLSLFYLLQQQLADEEKVLYHLREAEDELATFLRARAIENAITNLEVSLFNQEQNEDYRIGLREKEQEIQDSKNREVDEDIDYLAPYLVGITTTKMTIPQAAEIRDRCLTDFKQLLLDRACTLQTVFDKELAQMLKEQQQYEAKLGELTREDEERYLKQFYKRKYEMNILETRLVRHKELSSQRYSALVRYLETDKRLAVLHKKK